MNQSELFVRVFLSIIFGCIIGLESETREIAKDGHALHTAKEKNRLGGIRTYTVVSLLGAISGIFFVEEQFILTYILFVGIILFVLSAYILNVQLKKAFGLTTEFAVLITYTLGFGVTSNLLPLPILIAILVLLTFFLSQKRGIGKIVQKIEHREVIDVLKFALIALVILPFLPDRNFSLGEVAQLLDFGEISENISNVILINPRSTWFLVVVVSGINLFSYFMSRLLGVSRGLVVSGFLGGIISSTSSVIAFASKTKENLKESSIFAGASLIAHGVSFFSMSILSFIVSREFFYEIIPSIIIMSATSIVVGLVIILKNQSQLKNDKYDVKFEPFSIKPAIKFVSIILAIRLIVQLLQLLEVNNLVLVTVTAVSGAVGMDAPTIAYAELTQSAIITAKVGLVAYLFANFINSLSKVLYGRMYGTKTYYLNFSIGMSIVVLLGLIGIIL